MLKAKNVLYITVRFESGFCPCICNGGFELSNFESFIVSGYLVQKLLCYSVKTLACLTKSISYVCISFFTFLHCREDPMIPEDHEEVNMQEFDPESDRRQRSSMHDEDEEHMHGHGPGVSCATQ